MPKPTTWTWVRCAHEDEGSGKAHRLSRSDDMDTTIFKGMAQTVENASRDLEHLVEKQYSVMGETDFARPDG